MDDCDPSAAASCGEDKDTSAPLTIWPSVGALRRKSNE